MITSQDKIEKEFKKAYDGPILMFDSTFKYVFLEEKYIKLLIKLIYKYKKEKINLDIKEISAQKLIPSDNINIKDYYADLMITLQNEEKIIIDMYTKFNEEAFKKSFSYLCRSYSNQFSKKDKFYNEAKKIDLVLFSDKPYKDTNDIVNIISFKNNETNEVKSDSLIRVLLVRLDLVDKMQYTKNNKELIKYLKLFRIKKVEEMEEYVKKEGNKIMVEMCQKIKWYITSKEYRNMLRQNDKEKSVYMYEGKEIGEIETKKKIVVEMLKDNQPVDMISKYTKYNADEISDIAAEIGISIPL